MYFAGYRGRFCLFFIREWIEGDYFIQKGSRKAYAKGDKMTNALEGSHVVTGSVYRTLGSMNFNYLSSPK